MSDEHQATPGGGPGRADLERRLDGVERRLGRVEAAREAPPDRQALEAELAALREAVADLGADVLDLHNQLNTVVSACERLLAGAGAMPDLSGGRLRGSASLARRAARRVVGVAAAAARRLVGSRPEGPPPPLSLELRPASAPATWAPRVACVLPVTEDPAVAKVPPGFERQTDSELEVVLWNETAARAAVHGAGAGPVVVEAADRAALAAVLAADWVADLDGAPRRLEPTTFELCRWTLASEGLPLLVAADGDGPSARRVWRVLPKDDWRLGRNEADRRRLTKVVGGRDWRPPAPAAAAVLAAGGGRAYLTRRGRRGTLTHRAAPLAGVAAPLAADDPRPAVLVVSTADDGGRLAGWLLRRLGEELRCIVLLAGDAAASPAARDALASLAPEVYPVGAWLEPAVWPSAAADLARARGVGSVLRIGEPLPFEMPDGRRPLLVDWPLEAAQVRPGADRVLAVGAGIADRARAAGLGVTDLVPAPELSGAPPEVERLADVRAAYGIPENGLMVLAACDLEPGRRPEDVAAVAWRLRDRADVHVLLVGQGSLTGTVADIAGHLGLERFSMAPASHPMVELVASCDCVLDTAERDPWPVSVQAALALGRDVVATDIDGVRELVAAAQGERCALCQPGDLDGLARAVAEALGRRPRPRATKKAWKAAAERSRSCLEAVRRALEPAAGGAGAT